MLEVYELIDRQEHIVELLRTGLTGPQVMDCMRAKAWEIRNAKVKERWRKVKVLRKEGYARVRFHDVDWRSTLEEDRLELDRKGIKKRLSMSATDQQIIALRRLKVGRKEVADMLCVDLWKVIMTQKKERIRKLDILREEGFRNISLDDVTWKESLVEVRRRLKGKKEMS